MCSSVVLIICAVILAEVNTKRIHVSKRQAEDRWSWGYVDEPVSANNNVNPRQPTETTTVPQTVSKTTTTTPQPTTAEPLPNTTPLFCLSSYEPPGRPNYNAPGRRINEAKCMEYVWELNNRKLEAEQEIICRKYKRRKGGNHGVGGRNTKRGEFPHMGAVGWKATTGTWVFKCGSSLISEKFVLTAAHCTKASPRDPTIADVEPKIVRIGDKNIIDRQLAFSYLPCATSTGREGVAVFYSAGAHMAKSSYAHNSPPRKDATIARIIVHPQFKSPIKYYDIALMELNEVVQFSKFVQPACLWNKFSTSELGTQATGTGWGVIESGSLDISPELQAVTVDVLESSQCDQLLKSSRNRNWGGFHDDQLCAGKLAGGVDSCQGDSGGPLQMKMPLPTDVTDKQGSMHYVIGIISFGVGCAHPNLPGVYTRVSSFIDWIEENVWGNQ